MHNQVELERERQGIHAGREEFALDEPSAAVRRYKAQFHEEINRAEEDAKTVIQHYENAIEAGHGKNVMELVKHPRHLEGLFKQYGVPEWIRPHAIEIVQLYFRTKVEMARRLAGKV